MRITLALLLLFATRAEAEISATAPASRPAIASDKLAVSEHQLVLADGQVLNYRATAGFLPARDESGKDKGQFFFVAYDALPKAPALPATRPVTFVFNGGPGAAAVWLHLGTVGPMRIQLKNELGEAPAPPYKLVENPHTWLGATDLVFIDPIGTGYSRPAAGEKGEAFYGVKEDVASVGEFIRLYTTRYQRWLSPKLLAGESYGTTRAAALSNYLLDRYGIALNGIILISTVLDFQTIQFDDSNSLPYALYLPTYTAVAWYHKKLPAEFQEDLGKAVKESRELAMGDYWLALGKGAQLAPAGRKALVQKLARLTGLPAAMIEKADLRIRPDEFRKALLEDQRLLLGRFDGRIAGFDRRPNFSWPGYDPSYAPYHAVYSATINDYIRRGLRFESDLAYEVLTDRVQPWNWGRPHGGGGYLNVSGDLESAMTELPELKVFFASGYFDLATPMAATDYTIDHLHLSPALRQNITHSYFSGGHMLYHNRPALIELNEQVGRFIRSAAQAR